MGRVGLSARYAVAVSRPVCIELPKAWPSEVPVTKVVSGAALGTGKHQSSTRRSRSTDSRPGDEISAQLTGAGFTSKGDASAATDSGSVLALTSNKGNVAVIVTKGDDKTVWVANYAVPSPGAASSGN